MSQKPNFEDLQAWKSATELTLFIYSITRGKSYQNDFELINQLRRASISIMNNIAEGYHRYHKNDVIRFFNIAYSSCQEVKSMLFLSQQLGYIDDAKFNEGNNSIEKTLSLIGGFIRYSNQRR